ncbi:HET domain-containing protein [Xylariaceae sp. FL0255]|nr:HET domain-containing protein [Xylariaceae sp. FL0255]
MQEGSSEEACACLNVHFGCNATTCQKARHANRTGANSLKRLRQCATERKCEICSTLVAALLIPEIKSTWQISIKEASLSKRDSLITPGLAEDEEEIDITVETSWSQVKIVDTQEGAEGHYMTLSHRWGENETFKLTKANISKMKQNIPWNSIPKVYQDAIRITRELKVGYIWIDSLCIIQDDLADWERESIRMRTVYGNSYLNIAACRARDPSGELFSSSDLINRFPTYLIPGSEGIYIQRLLSPRVVYYDDDELKWECNGSIDCQCGGMCVIANFKREYMASRKGSRALPTMWMLISQRYSRLRLTYDTDRVIALARIADHAFNSGYGGRYLAGLWEYNLDHQLCWEITDTYREPMAYSAPSWSWLSVVGAVTFTSIRYERASCTVEIAEAKCMAANNQTGTITGGFIKISGKWIRLRARICTMGSEIYPPSYRLVHAETGVELGAHFIADYIMGAEIAAAIQDVWALYMGTFEDDGRRPYAGRKERDD